MSLSPFFASGDPVLYLMLAGVLMLAGAAIGLGVAGVVMIFGKSDEKACNWAFLSAMVALQKRAQQLGANAVVNIVSYYKKEVMSSASQFECHAGALIAGVALKGDFVKISE